MYSQDVTELNAFCCMIASVGMFEDAYKFTNGTNDLAKKIIEGNKVDLKLNSPVNKINHFNNKFVINDDLEFDIVLIACPFRKDSFLLDGIETKGFLEESK